ncbi:MAG TPA: c-type cytochrome [Pseudoxanthomonas sp.]
MRIAPLVLLCLSLVACNRTPPSPPVVSAPVPPAGDPVEGLRVATRVGCNGCHGPHGAGEVFQENPELGRIVAPNLTQRRTLYDDAALAALLREGRTHDGHVPWGMPIKMFQHLSDREVCDITAWVRGLPAIDNPSLPQGQWSDALTTSTNDGTHPWLVDMVPDPGHEPPAAPPTQALALGRHLAYTSCTECHAWDLNGWEGDPAPSLVVAKAYTLEQFTRLMRTGEIAAGGKSKTGMMSGVAAYRYPVMTDEEIAALKLFLDSR